MNSISSRIQQERASLDEEDWGGADNDDARSLTEWQAYIQEHAARITQDNPEQQLVRVAALAVAALESLDRKRARASYFNCGAESQERHALPNGYWHFGRRS